MNTQRTLFDFNKVDESTRLRNFYDGNGIKDTEIIIKDLKGNLRFKGRNAIILPGAAYTATQHFEVTPPVTLPNYNNKLGLEQTVNTQPEAAEKIYLFAMASDGCGPEASQIYPVNYKKWADPTALIPFKYETEDILSVDRAKYFGRKVIGSGGDARFAYYFKAFESSPNMVMQYKDGTPIDANIYETSNELEVETYVELRLRVTTTDARSFFKATTGIATANVNSIMLLRAWPKVVNGITYYQNIQPVTKLNISNESLVDETKGLDIIYHLYY